MTFKDKLKEKTYSNSHILNLTYKDKKGNEKTEEVILKRSNSFLGDWKKIYPVINKDGSVNWINFVFGGWKNFIKMSFVMILILYVFFGYLGEARQYMDGNKYVIITKDSFIKYCENNIALSDLENVVEHGNLSNYTKFNYTIEKGGLN